MMIVMVEGIKSEVLNMVPELVEGDQAIHSLRRFFASEEGGGKRRGALFLPFDKLRDQKTELMIFAKYSAFGK